MKIVITGCTGSVGREIVPHLAAAGAQLLLVGRDPDKIARMFPGLPAASYEDIEVRARGFDTLAHLAVLNNDVPATPDQFRQANVVMAVKTLEAARAAGIGRLVLFSTMHALDPANRSAYADSKREAQAALSDAGIDVTTLYLPAVYGTRWAGKLAMLNRLPRRLGAMLFTVLAAFKPVVDAGKIASFLLDDSPARAGRDIFLYDDKDENPVFRFVKRTIDLAFAVAILSVFWWLLIALWVWVRVQSSGPGIFAQTRVGRHGRAFTCYKFRTMVTGTLQRGTHEITVGSVTSVGQTLRRTKLDELPQVWNILRNDISLVGPRPCLPVQTDLVERRMAAGVYDMKPGITGYAQIHDVDMSDPVRLTTYDARYKALRSLIFDLKILIGTFLGRGQGDRTGR